MGGGTNTVERAAPSQPNPPSLLPEAKAGYEQGQAFYQDVLANPPVYGGPTVAGVPNAMSAGLTNLQDIGAGGPGIQEQAGRNLNFTTSSGGSLAADPYASVYDTIDPSLKATSSGVYLDPAQNPFFAGAQRNILDPIFEKYNTQVRPGIRDRFISQGGEGGSRSMLTEEQGLRDLGRSSTDALAGWEAGIYENERALQERAGETTTQAGGQELSRAGNVYGLERQLQEQASAQSGKGTLMDLLRANTLIGAGTQERALDQEQIAAQRAAFEEPIYRQSAAAQSLLQQPTSAGMSGGSSSVGNQTSSALSAVQGLGSTALMMYLLYGLMTAGSPAGV